ncbi:hypothetical protein CQW23_32874 [Capsicum baccatum]|uniref:Uncharacterized protein n=1 Tax=Capsicum baccatum TaxID=33114 RepID=A0A2G2V3F6_CAPBA|nr:hypothetical protein CQW23_32874 [Capsicum baccatum]
MESQSSKSKAKVRPSTSARKRSRPSKGKLTRVPRDPLLQRGQVQKFGFKDVQKDGKQWYTKHTNAKYILEAYIDRDSLMRECPSMIWRIEALNMNFIFHQPTECNLHLVREFYANWDPNHPKHLLKVHWKVIRFTTADVNELLGSVIFFAMKKARTQVGHNFGFGGLVTTFVRRNRVDEEELDYKPEARTDEVLGRLYGLIVMMSRIGERPATPEELHVVEIDYLLGHHASTILRIGPDLLEPDDDNVPTDEEHRYRKSNMESDEEEKSNDDGADDDGDDVDVAPEDMSAIVPFE